jgi:tRNA threonylcarbamoyladenosine biosynthesis protein TsaB
MMKLLALDTATEACSAALWLDGEIITRYELTPREHAHSIIPMMDELLQEAGLSVQQLDAIAFGRGPGSFTGVRIAASLTQGAAYGADLPVIPVSTLATLAQAAIEEQGADRILPAIDARMQEVYWAEYRKDSHGYAELVGEERVIPPDQVPIPDDSGYTGIGSGWKTYAEELGQRLGTMIVQTLPDALPQARYVARLAARYYEQGVTFEAAQALPVYLRDQVAKKSAPKPL